MMVSTSNMDRVTSRLEESIEAFGDWEKIAEAHMVNFICDNHWDNIVPPEIQEVVALRGTEWAINQFWKHGRGEPLETNALSSFMEKSSQMALRLGDGICLKVSDLKDVKPLPQLPPQQLMSPKKSHEVLALSYLVKDLAEIRRATHIIDIGGGKGYLSSFMAFHHNLKVLSLDSCDRKTIGAAKRVQKMHKHFKTIENITRASLYKQDTAFIDKSTNLIDIVTRNFESPEPFKLGLVGLHTCGELAPASLKLFVTVPEVDFLVNVGCCYHLMESQDSFPLSNLLKSKGFTLSRNPLMLALQAKTRFLSNETMPNESLLYRAVLQQIIADKGQLDRITGTVGRATEKCGSFFDYVVLGLKNLGLDFEVTESEVYTYLEKCKLQREKLVIFFMLRVYVASVIENIILLDRLLYLMEEGFEESFLVQIFDPIISPRCHGIVALK